jgi:hypothetical protein
VNPAAARAGAFAANSRQRAPDGEYHWKYWIITPFDTRPSRDLTGAGASDRMRVNDGRQFVFRRSDKRF